MALERENRFQPDAQRGSDILSGFQKASSDPVNKQFILRQLKPYKKFGIPQGLKGLKGMSDAQLEKLATKAVLKRKKVKVKKLRTTVNKKKFTNVQRAKQVMKKLSTGQKVNQKALKKTADTRRHIKKVRRNRRISRSPIWQGKGYDILKGYI